MPDCTADKDPCEVSAQAGEAWNICLPWGGRIWSDADGVHAQGGNAPPDGVYGKIVIANGCIVGVESEDVPLYTGSPCAPLPVNCGGESTLGGGFTPGSTTITCEIEAGSGVTVTGSGTTNDPYVISADTGIYLRSDNAAIAVSGSGTRTSPFTVKHKSGLATTVNGLTFDAYGHLTSANTSETAGNKGIKGIVPSFGIAVSVDNSTGIATISQQNQPASVPGDYQFGGYAVTLDKAGQVSAIKQQIEITDAPITAPCGTVDLRINQYGAITDVVDAMNLGSGYLAVWNDASSGSSKGAQFTMRCGSALAGVVYTAVKDLSSASIAIDGQNCQKIENLFWGSGIFLAGQHRLTITGVSGKAAVMLMAVTMADSAW